jgi:hypothetical protein
MKEPLHIFKKKKLLTRYDLCNSKIRWQEKVISWTYKLTSTDRYYSIYTAYILQKPVQKRTVTCGSASILKLEVSHKPTKLSRRDEPVWVHGCSPWLGSSVYILGKLCVPSRIKIDRILRRQPRHILTSALPKDDSFFDGESIWCRSNFLELCVTPMVCSKGRMHKSDPFILAVVAATFFPSKTTTYN